MDIQIFPGKLSGTIPAIPSKSQAHRLLICAAFADAPVTLNCPDTNADIEATVRCLQALGADIQRTAQGYQVTPAAEIPPCATLPCGESGSTVRFLLPVAGALGVRATFLLEGRLPDRPLSPLWEEMERMGCTLSRPAKNRVLCQGRLRPGAYTIRGDVSSQFITGLLLALNLLPEESTLQITGKLESRPYVDMTKSAMICFSADPEHPGRFPFRSPKELTVEGDWSNASFFLAAAALGSAVSITNLNGNSLQGDRAASSLLPLLAARSASIDAGDIPDLVPILAVAAGTMHGAVFRNIGRLRLKESDRVESVLRMIRNLGGAACADANTLFVNAAAYCGGTVDSCGDHRIAMAAAIAATVCTGPVILLGAEAVNKSYPNFWQDFRRLGGNYEQYIR